MLTLNAVTVIAHNVHIREQNKNSEFCAPLTSFDWNETDPNILGASSIDTTCTIWGLEVGTLASFIGVLYLQFLIARSMQKQREKAWEILSRDLQLDCQMLSHLLLTAK